MGAHSYDPGTSTSGVLWVAPIPNDSVSVNLSSGRAVMDIKNIPVFDWSTIPNSLNPAHPLGMAPATASIRVEWGGVKRRVAFSDPVNGFKGYFLENTAVVKATMSTPSQNFVLDTDPANITVHFAEIAHESSGGIRRPGLF